MKKAKLHKNTIPKFKRLPRAGIIYAIRSQDIFAVQSGLTSNLGIQKLNSNNNKVLSHQISEDSWNSSASEGTLSYSSKDRILNKNEKVNLSGSSESMMQHLFIENYDSNNNRKVDTNQNSLIVHRGSFDSNILSDASLERVNSKKKRSKDHIQKHFKRKDRHIKEIKSNHVDEVIKPRLNIQRENFGINISESNLRNTSSEHTKRSDDKQNWEKTLSKSNSEKNSQSLNLHSRKHVLEIKEKECGGDSDSSVPVYQARNNDDLLSSFHDVSLELSRLKVKYNELILENSSVKQKYENLSIEIHNLKYENSNVKIRNETLAAKNLENQNLSRIIDSLNQKMKELYMQIDDLQSHECDKTRRIVDLEKNLAELQEKSSSCNVEMAHLRNQLSQKDLELKRMSNKQKIEEEKDLQIKLIHNELIELRGNIRILCRIKPEANNLIQIINNESLQLPAQRSKSFCNVYNFNRVFKSSCSQTDVFCEVRQLITSFVDGYNVNMITYGQSGSGKTFTMIGTKDEPGIVTHSIREVFKLCKQRTSWSFKIYLSVLEIYNETIFDLLTVNQSVKHIYRKRIQIHDDGKCIHIKGLSEIEIKHEEELLNYINKSKRIRSTCVTTQNSDSSRSHFIVMLRIYGKNTIQNCSSQGVLMLCDLAGSENCTSSLSDYSITESKYISRSLTVLGRVFEALYNKLPVIPFRDSKLTHMLKPSLSGDAKFAFIITISGRTENLNNTIRVLNLAKKISQISLGQPRKNTSSTRGIVRNNILCPFG